MTHANDPADPDTASAPATDAPASSIAEPEAPAADAQAEAAVTPEDTEKAPPPEASLDPFAAEAAPARDADPALSDDDEPGDSAEETALDPADIARIKAMFSRFVEEPQNGDGAEAEQAAAFRFARWDRGLSPRVFGVDDISETAILGGVSEAARLARVEIVEEDPEFEANLLIFVCEEWRDLKQMPGLGRLIPDLDKLVVMLGATGVNQYRIFSFSEEVGLRLAVVLVRCDEVIGRMSARALGLSQAAQTLLLWSDAAFVDDAPVATSRRGEARIKPWISDLLAASYEEGVPAYSEDPAVLERLAASSAARRRAAKAASAARKSGEWERRSETRSVGEEEFPLREDGVSESPEQEAKPETASAETETTQPEAADGGAVERDEAAPVSAEVEAIEETQAPKPARKRRSRAKKAPAPAAGDAEAPETPEPASADSLAVEAAKVSPEAASEPTETPEQKGIEQGDTEQGDTEQGDMPASSEASSSETSRS